MSTQSKLYKPGEYLFQEGQPAHCIMLILSGTVSIRKKKKSEQIEVAKFGTNQIIGELSFFDRKARSASAVAITPVKAMEIGFEALEKIYGTVPPYLKVIIESLAERLRKTNEALAKMQKASSAEDLAIPEDQETEEDADGAAVLAAISGEQSTPTKK